MSTVLEIEGQLVRTIERTVVNEVPLADMLDKLERRPPVILPTLPRNRVLGLYWDESNPLRKVFNIALAQAPSIRLIPLDPTYAVPDFPPRLALPWTIFVFEMHTNVATPTGGDWAMNAVTFWFSRDEPKGTDTDNLIPALLPNVYTNANICWGTTGVNARQPLNDRIDQTINEFYQTQFNHGGDIPNNWPYYRPTYKRWARETIEQGAACYRNWTDWDDDRRTHKTLRDVLSIDTDVTVPIVLPDGIPVIPVTPSFGRAEAWINDLTQLQRNRLAVALDNLRTENPAAFEAPAPTMAVAAAAANEDDD